MSKVTFQLPAGIKVREIIEDLTGIITSRVERINGCIQYYVDPPRLEDGKTIVKGCWADFENLEIVDRNDIKLKSETVDFKFETGDRVRNRIHDQEGFITVRRYDLNKCIMYWYENGEKHPETGDMIDWNGFEQEFELIDRGLNAPVVVKEGKKTKQKPVARAMTGCRHIESST